MNINEVKEFIDEYDLPIDSDGNIPYNTIVSMVKRAYDQGRQDGVNEIAPTVRVHKGFPETMWN